ncbi:unnamed protein product, partial [Sphagnum tenellum]
QEIDNSGGLAVLDNVRCVPGKQLRDDAIKSGYNELIPEAFSPVPGGPEELPDMCWTHADEAKISEGSQGLSLDFKSLVFLFEGAVFCLSCGNTVSRITLGVVVINQDEGTKRTRMTIFPVRESHSTLYFSPSSVLTICPERKR